MYPEVRLEVDGAVATIVFDHERRRNAMTKSMWEAIPGICRQLQDSSTVRVVVMRGAGTTAFVAGADISEFEEVRLGDGGPDYDRMTGEATAALAHLPQPVVALIHGFCIGGGLALALSADIRYAADNAEFGLPPARLGIGYSPVGVGHLVDIVGPGPAMELLFTADWFPASTALRWGLINEIVPAADLDPFVAERVGRMVERAPLSQRAAKLAVGACLAPLDDARQVAAGQMAQRCYQSNDYREGVRAFLGKRTPRFTGT